jgi:hypothetical protein
MPVSAGGIDWDFAITDLVRDKDNYRLQLESKVKGAEQPMGCHRMFVDGEYAWFRWIFNSSLSRTGHSEALDYLELSKKNNIAIRFGSMGEGLVLVEGSPCNFKSKGLSLIKDVGGTAVYSFYKE